MSTTVLRVKRRLEDNPQDAMVLSCKRIKIDTEEISPSLFVFRGTVENQESIIAKNMIQKHDVNYKLPPAQNVNTMIEKIRQERKEASADNRYELVNCSRGLQDLKDNEFNVVDLQKKSEDECQDVQYAYDIYISAKENFDISMIDNLVSIENYETDMILGSYRDNGLDTSDEDVDDEDSNDENNSKNEYPDSDASTIDDEDIVKAVENCNIDEDLSSDEGEDKIYDDQGGMFGEDAKRYGAAYAKYKAKVLGQDPDLSNSLIHSIKVKDLDEESIEGYKDDSDDGFYYGQEQDTDQFREQYDNDDLDYRM